MEGTKSKMDYCAIIATCLQLKEDFTDQFYNKTKIEFQLNSS